MAFEDLFGTGSPDDDFNDSLTHYYTSEYLNYRNQVVKVTGAAQIYARGAGYDHNQFLAFQANSSYGGKITGKTTYTNFAGVSSAPVNYSGTQRVDLDLFTDTKAAFSDGGANFNNTETSLAPTTGSSSVFEVDFNPPIDTCALQAAPYDPYLLVKNTGYDIHLAGNAPIAGSKDPTGTTFLTSAGLVWALCFNYSWKYPQERFNIATVYSQFSNWVASNGAQYQNWYLTYNAGLVY